MRRIYLDNAATSWPKPEAVTEVVAQYLQQCGAPAGRGAYREATDVERAIARVRSQVAALIGAPEPSSIVFTCNGTDSLNLGIHGLVRPGDRVVSTVIEHNSVLRPLHDLMDRHQVEVTWIECDAGGLVDLEQFATVCHDLQPHVVVCNHTSNVTGAVQDLDQIRDITTRHQSLLIIDAAQSLGQIPFTLCETSDHVVAAPAHKGLLGMLGLGIAYVNAGVQQRLRPPRQGGTGTVSDHATQPTTMPDRFESGNLNVPAIMALGAGLDYLQATGIESIQLHHQQLIQRLAEGLGSVPGVRIFAADSSCQAGILSCEVEGYDPQEVAGLLDASYGIQVRAGHHCAPWIHQRLGAAEGTVRFSVGPFNTADDIDATISAVTEIAQSAAELI